MALARSRSETGSGWRGAFIGSEGTLGIATKIVLRLIPRPASVATLLAVFDNVEQASTSVSAIIGAGLVPAADTIERYQVQGWLTHIGTELHKTFGPMFRPTTPDAYKAISKENLAAKYKNIDKHLAGRQYLMGDRFGVADAYLFTVTRWSPRVELDLSPFPNVGAFMERVAARPKVREALEAEGLA